MANILDYLDWRGDLTFGQAEFNEVDNLILTQLSYVDLEGIVPSIASLESITVREASSRFFQIHDEKELISSVSLVKMCPFTMKKMAHSQRFSDVRLCGYVNTVDFNEQKQFSAISIELDEETLYVAFRGTDDSIVGWKEDFNMCFMSPVPAQIEAVRYVEQTARQKYAKILLGGHSKGGNLAVYAAVNCCPSVKERIKAVFNNDGPGFDKSIIESQAYQEIRGIIRTIVPYSSIIGMLLEHAEEYVVVKSSQNGVMQHDALSWEVLGNRFVTVDNISRRSRLLDAALKAWVSKLDKTDREQFVQALFHVFEATNVKSLVDLSHDKLKKMGEIMKALSNMAPENKEVLKKTIKLLFSESNRVLRNRRLLE